MSIHTKCPECQKILNVPDRLAGKRVSCPTCAITFFAPGDRPEEDSPRKKPEAEESPRPARAAREQLQNGLQRTPSGRLSDADFLDDEEVEALPRHSLRRHEDEDGWEREPPRGSSGLLIAGVMGGVLILAGGGVLLWWLLRSADKPAASTSDPLAQAPALQQPVQGQQPVIQPAAGDPPPGQPANLNQPIDPAPAPGVEGIPPLPGGPAPGPGALPKPPPPPGVAGAEGAVTVVLTGGQVTRSLRRGRNETLFKVDYRCEGAPPAGTRYIWVIKTRVNRQYEVNLRQGSLRAGANTLSARPLGFTVQGPYDMYIAVKRLVPGRPGFQEERISNVITVN